MRRRDIILGFIVLVVLVAGALWIRNARRSKLPVITTPSIEELVEETFNNLEIPDDVEKTELSDVSGGNGVGIATRDMVLADLPEPEVGTFYQVWVERSGSLISLGKMRVAKGGFLLEGRVDGEKIIVSQEKTLDASVETKILEGSF